MNKYFKLAYKEALKAYRLGECPIGCVIVLNDKVIAKAHNLRENKEDPLGHAEILAIKKASHKLKTWRLEECDLYVTLEPCLMCAGAIVNSRIKNVYFNALDKRNGAVVNNCDSFNLFTHKVKAHYIEDNKSSLLITNFFKDLRYNLDFSNVVLNTDRLLLRPFKETDVFDFYEYAKVEGVGELAGWSHHKDIETSKMILTQFIANKDVLAISKDNKVIGSVGIHKVFDPAFQGLRYREIGYVLSKDYWGFGYMQEALGELISYLFEVVKLDVIKVGHYDFNYRSKNTIISLGFSKYQTRYKQGKKIIEYYLTRDK